MSATLKDEIKKAKAITVEQLEEMEAECSDLYEALDKEDPSLIK